MARPPSRRAKVDKQQRGFSQRKALLAAVGIIVPLVALLSAFRFSHVQVRETIPAFEVVDLPGKGKGIVAVRDIEVRVHSNLCQTDAHTTSRQQGELLIREAPLVTVPPTSRFGG